MTPLLSSRYRQTHDTPHFSAQKPPAKPAACCQPWKAPPPRDFFPPGPKRTLILTIACHETLMYVCRQNQMRKQTFPYPVPLHHPISPELCSCGGFFSSVGRMSVPKGKSSEGPLVNQLPVPGLPQVSKWLLVCERYRLSFISKALLVKFVGDHRLNTECYRYSRVEEAAQLHLPSHHLRCLSEAPQPGARHAVWQRGIDGAIHITLDTLVFNQTPH